jgi:hypothetical protein
MMLIFADLAMPIRHMLLNLLEQPYQLVAISNNLLSVGISINNNNQNFRGIVYNQYGNKYNINTNNNIGFSDLKNNDTYTYICGGILIK